MSDGHQTVPRGSLADVTRELREHAASCTLKGCLRCELFDVGRRGTVREIDAFITRIQSVEWTVPNASPNASLLADARAIRHSWGEGDWTNP